MSFNVANVANNLSKNMKEMQKSIAEAKQYENGYANIFYEQLIKEINRFDNELDQTQEVGIRLVTYGSTIQFHIIDIGYQNPYLIYFYGQLDDGSPIQLVQHVSQISFVLISMKRVNTEEPKKPIGFITE